MKTVKRLFLFIIVVSVSVIAAYYYVIKIPQTPLLNVSNSGILNEALQCYENKEAKAIDQNGRLDIFVWNIFKQENDAWRESLEEFSQNTSLGLLQEVSMTDDFKSYARKSKWFSSHVDAFSAFGVSSGVLNFSVQSPLRACAFLEIEPWILLPKSGIYAVFRLTDKRKLAVVNLHSVNFAYGIEEYEKQITALSNALKTHKGPVIFAGDLNTWSMERFNSINVLLGQHGLKKVEFSPDNRKPRINGKALDHVFYRELELVTAQSPSTEASDHNPLLVKFRL
jgi:endonuclease/exonuclease/phosphatase (EEP) superfamily protein YafD